MLKTTITQLEDIIKKQLVIIQQLETNNIAENYSQCEHINDKIFCHNIKVPKYKKNKKNKKGKRDGKRLADKPIDSKIINGKEMAKWGDKWLPVCDGSGFPYVEGCYHDMSNWSPGSKQCIIKNPGTSNLASGSLYTCGFLW